MTYTPIVPGSLNWDVPINAQFTNDDTRLNGLDANFTFLTLAFSGQGALIAALQTNNQGATDQGLVSWTYDPVVPNANSALTAGALFFSKFILYSSANVNSIIYNVGSAGSGLTAGQNFVAIYNNAGVRQVVSGDQTTNFGSTGTKTAAVGPVALTAGTYYVAFLSNGTTPPSMRSVTQTDTMLNAGTTVAAPRFARFGAGLTATPASFTMGSSTLTSFALWGAID